MNLSGSLSIIIDSSSDRLSATLHLHPLYLFHDVILSTYVLSIFLFHLHFFFVPFHRVFFLYNNKSFLIIKIIQTNDILYLLIVLYLFT